ncbi:UbiD decarboxylyase family [Aspergillus tamarii]|uniref:Ferulic acid decarboxylase 1 n=1 Tax=Aspergillus tamarii TaxID=41984 RepID=A0A5N6UFA2_ASPTM|nr:UbiD decarboxylyase family [Aspergillus tamarii]
MDHTAAAKDFRRFIQELEDEGELLTITKEVDPNLELAAIVRKVCETGEQAPLFTNPKGRKDDGLFRVLGASIGYSKRPGMQLCRLAKSLGLPSSATGHEIVQKINEAKSKPPIPCRKLESGPVKDHIIHGDDIDLTQLPVPLLHEHDGGKFIETMGMHVVQSPDGKWTNWSISRGMVHGKRELVGLVIPRQDIGTIWNLWKEKGEDMPWALCFGVPPAAIMVGGMPIPKWTNEPEFIGALTDAPVDIVKCETNDLWVPANAEIVLEGVVSISETAPEGPMVEYNGMVFPGHKTQCPIFKVNTITYRQDPILPICVAGRAPDENSTIWCTMQAAEVLNICQKAGLPINMVWCPFESHCLWFVLQVNRSKLVEMRTNMDEFCRKLGHVVFGSKPGWFIPKIFLVNDYIDPTNLPDVIWAEATRCEPGRHEFIFTEYSNIPLIPYVTHGLPSKSGMNGKVVKCCMLPSEFTEKTLPWKEGSFQGAYPEDVKRKVLDNWTAYGFQPL